MTKVKTKAEIEIEVKAGYKREIEGLKLETPVGKQLVKMGIEEPDIDRKADILCMCVEVQAFEKQKCTYCKGTGHKHAVCPLFARLKARFRGDRDINKLRGKKSVKIRRDARKTLRVISKRKIAKRK